MELIFDTEYSSIQDKIARIDPIQYGKTRNYINGSVTYLSPYISRGVISTKQVLDIVLKKGYQLSAIESFVKELCWRDYFQRVGQLKDLNHEIKQSQAEVAHHEIPVKILQANTGIEGIDREIQQLYSSGYMHNHCRMYTASLVCNLAHSHWHLPAKWMYYHLLDGDWASNACSWQWVAAANSNKKYYANQDNINQYTLTQQRDTFLDKSYEVLETMSCPVQLSDTSNFLPELILPETHPISLDPHLPTFIYNYYNMDPEWHKNEPGNRVLLLEPDFFSAYPVSRKCIDFILALSKNIPNIQVYTGSFESLCHPNNVDKIYYKEHPFNKVYFGTEEPRDWICETIKDYYPSFFAYWKAVEKHLSKKHSSHVH